MASESVLAEMLEKMRVKDGDDDRIVLSKKLSYVLRHGARQLELQISDGGFVSVRELLAIGPLFGGVAPRALMQFVDESNLEKKRYELQEQPDGDYLIRAINKHTIDGLEKPNKPKDKERRARETRRDRGRDVAVGGRGGETARPIVEEEFCAKWKLDRLARARLAELPKATRQQAMQKFRPGHEVPSGDYPKVFVAFCKRFKATSGGPMSGGGKPACESFSREEDGDELGDEGTEDGSPLCCGVNTPSSCSPGTSARYVKGKARDDWEDLDMDAIAFGQQAGEARATADEIYPVYLSPDSSPRSPRGGLGVGCGGPPSAPVSPQQGGGLLLGTTPALAPIQEQQLGFEACWSPARRPPAPPQAPAEQLMRGRAQPPVAPPPPTHAPQSVSDLPLQLQIQLPRGVPPPPPAHPPKVAGLGLPEQQHGSQLMGGSPGGSGYPMPASSTSPSQSNSPGSWAWRQRQEQGQQQQGPGPGVGQWSPVPASPNHAASPTHAAAPRADAVQPSGAPQHQWGNSTWLPRGAAC